MITFVYKLFLGVLLATTIGMGISTFYPGPKAPEYPVDSAMQADENLTSAQQKQLDKKLQESEQKYQQKYEKYEKLNRDYQRNVAIIAITFSIIILVISLVASAKLDILADGLLLGGILTLLYAITASFWTEDQKFIFISTLVGFIVALTLGYVKFVKPDQKQIPARTKRKK